MRNRCTLFVVLGALLLCAPAFGGGSPVVYVSGGPSATVYKAAPPTVATPLLTDAGHQPEGMVFGPDLLVYVCEPQNGMIIRFDPSADSPVAQTVFAFSESGPSEPQCGRFDSTGDLLVSDVAGFGVWEFVGMAGSSSPTLIIPTNVLPASQVGGTDNFIGAGLAQLNNGDLIVANQANSTLYLAPYSPTSPHFSTASAITLSSGPSLDTPIGLARHSGNDIFVSNGGETDSVLRLTLVSGTTYMSTACATFPVEEGPNYQPNFLQFSADDTLYVAAQTTGNALFFPGAVFSVTLTNTSCNSPTQVATLPRWDSDSSEGDDGGNPDSGDDNFAQAIGIALPPTGTATVTKPISTPAGRNFNFNFTSFQISNTPANCSATVQATQTPLSTLTAAFALPSGASFIPYLGEAGFGTVYSVNPTDCADGEVLVGAFTPSLLNPRIIKCHPNLAGTCSILTTNAVYPLGGPLPGDGSLGGSAGGFSDFFVIDEGLSTAPGVAGTFCGFNPPLTNTTDPASAPVFSLSTTGTIPVKFLLGQGSSCNKFITNATALLSVAEVDPGFAPIFPLKFNGQGSSSAIFGLTGKQYHLNLDVSGYAPGIYSVSVTFLSGNAPPVTTYFKLVP